MDSIIHNNMVAFLKTRIREESKGLLKIMRIWRGMQELLDNILREEFRILLNLLVRFSSIKVTI